MSRAPQNAGAGKLRQYVRGLKPLLKVAKQGPAGKGKDAI
jgi:hypothetical protein